MILKNDTLAIEKKSGYITGLFHHDLDMETMLHLKPKIEAIMPQIDLPFILDLQNVHFLDSSAVGVIALFFRHAQTWRLPFLIVGAQPQPEAVLGMVGLSDYVPIYPDLGSGLASLSCAP